MSAQRASSQPRTITLTATDNMKFSVSTITARPGELLKVVLTVMGAQPPQQMAHNFVLLKPTADAGAFVMAAAMARDHGYIPPSLKGEVLAATSLASAGQTVTATFKAPAESRQLSVSLLFSRPLLRGDEGHVDCETVDGEDTR